MSGDLGAETLTPLQRLQLRDALQDLWRDQVHLITLLSLANNDDPGAADETAAATAMRAGTALAAARRRLDEIEQAMHRLDRRDYPRCRRCGVPVEFDLLMRRPERRDCAECTATTTSGTAAWSRAR